MVPSETNFAHFPLALNIADPAVADPNGATLAEALFTTPAAMLLMINTLPVNEPGAGNVNVIVAALFAISEISVAATV